MPTGWDMIWMTIVCIPSGIVRNIKVFLKSRLKN